MVPFGIAATCDWALLVPCLFGDVSRPPKTIFVHNYMLSHFVESTLNFMDPTYRFVLVTAGTDMTVPRSIDPRYRPMRGFSPSLDGGNYFQTLVNSPKIIHWFAENHDLAHHKLSTLPTGMSTPTDPDDMSEFPSPESIPPILTRTLKVLVSDRVRSGTGTWALRAEVVDMCSQSSLCIRPGNGTANMDGGIKRADYLRLLSTVPFVACVRGGGLDPSPKAWEAILLGTIPIIQHSVLDDGYERLPVVFIHEWTEIFESLEAEKFLLQKLSDLAPFYEPGSELRRKVLEVRNDWCLIPFVTYGFLFLLETQH
jgi:hypothetical protein